MIVDDNAEFLHAARTLLEQEGVEVVGVARTAAEALARAQELLPDVTLVDVDLGSASGLDLVRSLDASSSGGVLILISTQTQDDLAELAATTPAAGCISKPVLSAETIRQIAAADD